MFYVSKLLTKRQLSNLSQTNGLELFGLQHKSLNFEVKKKKITSKLLQWLLFDFLQYCLVK